MNCGMSQLQGHVILSVNVHYSLLALCLLYEQAIIFFVFTQSADILDITLTDPIFSFFAPR